MKHAIARHFLNQEISVFGKSDCEEHTNCLGGGFLAGVEDGFMLFSRDEGGKPDLAIALSAVVILATYEEDEEDEDDDGDDDSTDGHVIPLRRTPEKTN